MNAFLVLTARLYAPISTAHYFADVQLRLNEQCPRSVKHEARLPQASE